MAESSRLAQVQRIQKKEIVLDPDYKRLEQFTRLMEEKGIIEKTKYSIPPLDTIGRSFMDLRNTR